MSLREFAALSRCQGVATTLRYASDASLDEFRAAVRAVATGLGRDDDDAAAAADDEVADEAARAILVVSFSRSALGQTGSGHFSPIAGYHAPTDSVLVIDIARFKCATFSRGLFLSAGGSSYSKSPRRSEDIHS